MPNGVSHRGVMLLHQLEVLVPRFLGVRFKETPGHQVLLHLAIIPSGVDVILGLVEGLQGTVCAGRNQAGKCVGDGVGERRTGVLVGIVVVHCEADQLLLGSFRCYDPLFEKEFAEARLVPRLKGSVPEILEGFLSAIVLFVSPRAIRPPVLGHEFLEVLLRVVQCSWDIDLVLLEPGLQLFRIPFGVF